MRAVLQPPRSPRSLKTQKGTNRAQAGTNRDFWDESGAMAGTNPRREVALAHALAGPRHALRAALWAALCDSLGLIGPAHKHHWAEHLAMPCPARVSERCSVVAQAAIVATWRRFAKIPATITPAAIRAKAEGSGTAS